SSVVEVRAANRTWDRRCEADPHPEEPQPQALRPTPLIQAGASPAGHHFLGPPLGSRRSRRLKRPRRSPGKVRSGSRRGEGRMLPAWPFNPTSTASPITNAHPLWNTSPATTAPITARVVSPAFSFLRALILLLHVTTM